MSKYVYGDSNGTVHESDAPFIVRKRLGFRWHFVGWDCLSLGFHVCFSMPNVEIHLPFSFVRAGWIEEVDL